MELSATFPKAFKGQTKSTKHMHFWGPNHSHICSPGQNAWAFKHDETRLNKWLWIYEITFLNCRLINEDTSDYRRYEQYWRSLRKRPDFCFSGFTFTIASVAFIPAKNNILFKTKQGGETVKCLLTRHFLMCQGFTKGSNLYIRK